MNFHSTVRYLILGVFAAALAGCSSPSGAPYTSSIEILPTSSSLVHLEAGGLAIRAAGDTAVNFDLEPTVSVKNTSDTAVHLLAVWELQSTTPKVIMPNETPTITDPDLIVIRSDLGIVAPGATVPIDSILIATISDSDLAGGKLQYILSIELPFPLPSLTRAEGIFDSVPFTSHWRGIDFTTEASPNPTDIIDSPDDSDWQATSLFTPKPAYPNPAIGATSLPITISALDSVSAKIYITPHHLLETVVDRSLPVGENIVTADLSRFTPGLYRVIWTGYKGDTVVSSHGDIMVPLH